MADYLGRSGRLYRISDKPFDGGGEGDIFDVINKPNIVAKIFNANNRTIERERKITFEAANKPCDIDQYAWPIDILNSNGRFVGFIMPRVSNKRKLRHIYIYDKRTGLPWSLFIAIAKNLSAAVNNVHEIHQIIGDLNTDNILVDTNDGTVALVDIDSYHISDSNRTYRCAVGMPAFVAPELQGIAFASAPLPTFTIESDRFSLAVIIFLLLFNGAHPFSCSMIQGSSSRFQPIDNIANGICAFFKDRCPRNMEIPKYAPDINMLPDYMQNLFRRAFVDGIITPTKRPTAEEWYYSLEKLENELRDCIDPKTGSINALHIYYKGAQECPWCRVNEKMHHIRKPSQPVVPSSPMQAYVPSSQKAQIASVSTTASTSLAIPSSHSVNNAQAQSASATTTKNKLSIKAKLMVLTMCIVTILAFCIYDSIKWNIKMTPEDYKNYSNEIHITSSHWPNKYSSYWPNGYSFVGTLEPGETDEYLIVTESTYLSMAFKTHTSDNHGVDITIIREDGYYMNFNSSNSGQLFFVGDYVELQRKGKYKVLISSSYKTDYVVTLDGYIDLTGGN